MNAKGNKQLKWFVIALSVAVLVLICTLVVITLQRQNRPDHELGISGGGEQLAPDHGIWICEDLGLTLSFDGQESTWSNNGTELPCMFTSNRISPYISVFEIAAKIPLDDFDGVVYGYEPGQRLFHFKISSFTNDSMIVSDENGNVYTFYRDDTWGQEDAVVPSSDDNNSDFVS